MDMYIVTSNYFYHGTGIFGVYSTIKRARGAIELFAKEDVDIVNFEDIGYYTYQFTTQSGETFVMEIVGSVVDEEYEDGIIEENE